MILQVPRNDIIIHCLREQKRRKSRSWSLYSFDSARVAVDATASHSFVFAVGEEQLINLSLHWNCHTHNPNQSINQPSQTHHL